MIHDLLKTTLPSRKEFKSFEESVEMWRFGFYGAGLCLKFVPAVFPSPQRLETHGTHL